MGDDTVVNHTCGIPFTVVASIDGKKGKRECLPMYYNNMCAPCGVSCCGGHDKTAKHAAAIKGGAPAVDEMER